MPTGEHPRTRPIVCTEPNISRARGRVRRIGAEQRSVSHAAPLNARVGDAGIHRYAATNNQTRGWGSEGFRCGIASEIPDPAACVHQLAHYAGIVPSCSDSNRGWHSPTISYGIPNTPSFSASARASSYIDAAPRTSGRVALSPSEINSRAETFRRAVPAFFAGLLFIPDNLHEFRRPDAGSRNTTNICARTAESRCRRREN